MSRNFNLREESAYKNTSTLNEELDFRNTASRFTLFPSSDEHYGKRLVPPTQHLHRRRSWSSRLPLPTFKEASSGRESYWVSCLSPVEFTHRSEKHKLIFYHSNPFNTYGVQNIANRYSSGGGTSTHMPGHASQRGNTLSRPTLALQVSCLTMLIRRRRYI